MLGTTYEGLIIFSKNTEDTAKWMTRGLGLRIESTYSDDISLRGPICDGSGTVEFYLHPSDTPPKNQQLGTFRTDNVDQHMKRMLELGCAVQRGYTDGPYNTPWGTRMVHMVSPEAIEFSLVSDLLEGQEPSCGDPNGT